MIITCCATLEGYCDFVVPLMLHCTTLFPSSLIFFLPTLATSSSFPIPPPLLSHCLFFPFPFFLLLPLSFPPPLSLLLLLYFLLFFSLTSTSFFFFFPPSFPPLSIPSFPLALPRPFFSSSLSPYLHSLPTPTLSLPTPSFPPSLSSFLSPCLQRSVAG